MEKTGNGDVMMKDPIPHPTGPHMVAYMIPYLGGMRERITDCYCHLPVDINKPLNWLNCQEIIRVEIKQEGNIG